MANETKSAVVEGQAVRLVGGLTAPEGATATVYWVPPASSCSDWVSIQLDPAFREDADDDGIREVKAAEVEVIR